MICFGSVLHKYTCRILLLVRKRNPVSFIGFIRGQLAEATNVPEKSLELV